MHTVYRENYSTDRFVSNHTLYVSLLLLLLTPSLMASPLLPEAIKIEPPNTQRDDSDALDSWPTAAGVILPEHPVLIHIPAQAGLSEGVDYPIAVRLDSPAQIKRVTLYFRHQSQKEYHSLPMLTAQGGQAYSATIEKKYIYPPGIEYYIRALDSDNNVIALGASFSPIEVAVNNKAAPASIVSYQKVLEDIRAAATASTTPKNALVMGDNPAQDKSSPLTQRDDADDSAQSITLFDKEQVESTSNYKWLWVALGAIVVAAAANSAGGDDGGNNESKPEGTSVDISAPTVQIE